MTTEKITAHAVASPIGLSGMRVVRGVVIES